MIIKYYKDETFTASVIAKKMGLKSAIELNKFLESIGVQTKDKFNNSWILKREYKDKDFIIFEEKQINGKKTVLNRKFTWNGMIFIKEKLKENNLYKGWK